QVDRPPRSRAQHEMGLDALRAPEDLQKADAVDRTGRTRNPHDDLLHGRSILETPHWRKAAPLRVKPSILRSASCEGVTQPPCQGEQSGVFRGSGESEDYLEAFLACVFRRNSSLVRHWERTEKPPWRRL